MASNASVASSDDSYRTATSGPIQNASPQHRRNLSGESLGGYSELDTPSRDFMSRWATISSSLPAEKPRLLYVRTLFALAKAAFNSGRPSPHQTRLRIRASRLYLCSACRLQRQGQGSAPNSPASPFDSTGEASRRQGASSQQQNLPESPYATPENGQPVGAPQRSTLEARGEQPQDRQCRADQQAALPESKSAPPGLPDNEGAQVSAYIFSCPLCQQGSPCYEPFQSFWKVAWE